MNTNMRSMAFLAALALAPGAYAASGDHSSAHNAGERYDKRLVERGKYLVKVAGCNDCHTAGYAPNAGKVPESQWLMGDTLGWRGPWGTTYPVNLRRYMRDMTEANWVKTAKALRSRPPMPWFALNDMTEQDLRAIYQYVRTLTPVGNAAPAYVPPGKEPQGPFVQFPAPPK